MAILNSEEETDVIWGSVAGTCYYISWYHTVGETCLLLRAWVLFSRNSLGMPKVLLWWKWFEFTSAKVTYGPLIIIDCHEFMGRGEVEPQRISNICMRKCKPLGSYKTFFLFYRILGFSGLLWLLPKRVDEYEHKNLKVSGPGIRMRLQRGVRPKTDWGSSSKVGHTQFHTDVCVLAWYSSTEHLYLLWPGIEKEAERVIWPEKDLGTAPRKEQRKCGDPHVRTVESADPSVGTCCCFKAAGA